ncbi:zincin-like metallopeptidase domain-containing protein, partial [Magnetospirillum fulvum]
RVRDEIHLPPKGVFVGQEAYYATLLHELGHATGHPSRLVRTFGPFGSELYAREELRAEIASYMLARDLGISHDPSNHASYVESWLKVLRDDKNEIFRAARDAETIKSWVTEPERRPELERAAQAHAAAIAATTQEPGMENRTLMPTGTAPEVTPNRPSVSDRPQLIAVPYAEKDQAKALGAKWDRDAKSWFIPAGLDPALFAKWTQAPVQASAQTPVQAPEQAPEQEPGTLFVGWHTPTIPGKESLVAMQSAGLPSGKFIALDHPFASQAHDPATAKAVEVRLVKVFDPEGIFDPAHIQRDGVLWDAMDAALDKDPDIAKAKARGDFNEYKRRFAEAQTKFLRSKGYEGYVRWIDGVDREENPEKANRELIVFDRERVKERASPEQSRSSAPEMPNVRPPAKGQETEELYEMDGSTWWNLRHQEMLEGAQNELDLAEWMLDLGDEPPPGTKIWIDGRGRRVDLLPQPTFLAVPFAEKEQAKALGAKWDRKAKAWYVPDGLDAAAFARWSGKPAAPASLSPVEEFAEACKSHGLLLKSAPVMDGAWHRVPVEGDRKGQISGSYRGFLDGRPSGQITNYKAGGTVKWVATGQALSDETRAQVQAEAASIRAERESLRLAAAEKAARIAFGVWENLAGNATPERSPYLAAKGVQGHGVRVDTEGKLMIPARDGEGRLWTLQVIGADGKRFLKESHKAGTFHVIEPTGTGTLDTLFANPGPVLIAEGYATAASIFEATGQPVIAAFDSGNLAPVAETIRARYPDRTIIIAADDDHANRNGNVGLEKATEAAQAVGGFVVSPRFTSEEMLKGLTDFNDLAQSRGPGAVRQAIDSALARLRGLDRSIA